MVVVQRIYAPMAMAALALGLSGCGQEEIQYKPRAAPSGAPKANMPDVPNVSKKPIKAGEAYTVWGVSYYLRNRVHTKEVAGQKLKVTGWITKTNLPDAPECAVHEGGKGDPEGCNPPIPTFWLGDEKNATEKETIKVLGWASNYAQLYDAMEKYDKQGGKDDKEPHLDTYWGVEMPLPLPNTGAKVTVEGTYSTTFTKSTKGTEADPIMGILSYLKIEYLEPPPEKATLPGVDRKK